MKPPSRNSIILCTIGAVLTALLFNVMAHAARLSMARHESMDATVNAALQSLASPWPPSMERADLMAGLAGLAVFALGALYVISNRHNYRYGEEHGSAHWAGEHDMRPYTDHDPARNLQMTATEGLALDTRATGRNLNVCVAGGSGSGKTRGYVLPNLARANMSYAVTDPKGEIYRSMREPLEKKGYRIKALNLVDLGRSAHFNPMAYINPATSEQNILELVDNLIDNTANPNSAKGESFWDESMRTLLRALVGWEYYTSDSPTLNGVVELLGMMEASEEDETKKSPVDAMMQSAREILREIHQGQDLGFESYDPGQLTRLEDGVAFAAAQYRKYEQGAGETKKSIIISLGVRLAPLQVSQVRGILADDQIDLHAVGEEKTAIFIIIPDTTATFNFLAAVFYQCLFSTLVYDADHTSSSMLSRPVHCFLDEFANIGKVPNFTRLVATIRSRGISVSIIIQTLAQLKSMYKDDWETLIGNCDSILFLGAGKGDISTPKWISELLGSATIDTRDISQSRGANGSYSISTRQAKRELMTAAELGSEKFPGDKCIYLLRGVSPFMSRKIDPNRATRPPQSSLKRTTSHHGNK